MSEVFTSPSAYLRTATRRVQPHAEYSHTQSTATRRVQPHAEYSHTHTQYSHTHTQYSHTHTQYSHTHTQYSHTHIPHSSCLNKNRSRVTGAARRPSKKSCVVPAVAVSQLCSVCSSRNGRKFNSQMTCFTPPSSSSPSPFVMGTLGRGGRGGGIENSTPAPLRRCRAVGNSVNTPQIYGTPNLNLTLRERSVSRTPATQSRGIRYYVEPRVETQRQTPKAVVPNLWQFERISLYCQYFTDLIPLSFVLGFYVSIVVQRWWAQWETLPWPDTLALFVSTTLSGNDNRARMMRRAILRYANLAMVLTFAMVSPCVKKRFPTLDHIEEAGLMTANERKIYSSMRDRTSHPIYWMPLAWAGALVSRARKENKIKDDFAVKTIIDEITRVRTLCGSLLGYDWISIPLVYTQVVTLAVYTFFLSTLMGRQFLDTTKGYKNNSIDFYIPIFTYLQFFFYMGWLKVAESLVNPFGEDDDDFEINWLVDRNLQVSYLIVDEMHNEHPELIQDMYWDEVVPQELPYTVASQEYKPIEPHLGSTANIEVSQQDMELLPVVEETEEDEEGGLRRTNSKMSNASSFNLAPINSVINFIAHKLKGSNPSIDRGSPVGSISSLNRNASGQPLSFTARADRSGETTSTGRRKSRVSSGGDLAKSSETVSLVPQPGSSGTRLADAAQSAADPTNHGTLSTPGSGTSLGADTGHRPSITSLKVFAEGLKAKPGSKRSSHGRLMARRVSQTDQERRARDRTSSDGYLEDYSAGASSDTHDPPSPTSPTSPQGESSKRWSASSHSSNEAPPTCSNDEVPPPRGSNDGNPKSDATPPSTPAIFRPEPLLAPLLALEIPPPLPQTSPPPLYTPPSSHDPLHYEYPPATRQSLPPPLSLHIDESFDDSPSLSAGFGSPGLSGSASSQRSPSLTLDLSPAHDASPTPGSSPVCDTSRTPKHDQERSPSPFRSTTIYKPLSPYRSRQSKLKVRGVGQFLSPDRATPSPTPDAYTLDTPMLDTPTLDTPDMSSVPTLGRKSSNDNTRRYSQSSYEDSPFDFPVLPPPDADTPLLGSKPQMLRSDPVKIEVSQEAMRSKDEKYLFDFPYPPQAGAQMPLLEPSTAGPVGFPDNVSPTSDIQSSAAGSQSLDKPQPADGSTSQAHLASHKPEILSPLEFLQPHCIAPAVPSSGQPEDQDHPQGLHLPQQEAESSTGGGRPEQGRYPWHSQDFYEEYI
ncbi:Bestrophin/UPF0187 [Trinorchestia longiramus]|nr:Bestrophin/UPF0187 [Trinorchestia longiramus]